jgi:hypothetical protein
MYRPELNESAMHWALRLFGFVRGKQPPPPPSLLAIALYVLVAVIGLGLMLAGYRVGGLLLGPFTGLALGSLWFRRRPRRANPN